MQINHPAWQGILTECQVSYLDVCLKPLCATWADVSFIQPCPSGTSRKVLCWTTAHLHYGSLIQLIAGGFGYTVVAVGLGLGYGRGWSEFSFFFSIKWRFISLKLNSNSGRYTYKKAILLSFIFIFQKVKSMIPFEKNKYIKIHIRRWTIFSSVATRPLVFEGLVNRFDLAHWDSSMDSGFSK